MFFRETLRGIPLPTRQAQRRREGTSGAIPAFVPDGATLIRPTASSRKLLYRQARQAQRRRAMTAGTVLLLCRAAAH
ncbi:hypothetical protein KTC90_02100, partial [Klebsiella pneumoniae]|nr:hypothetical protein [Klebsiella pneumoniae]